MLDLDFMVQLGQWMLPTLRPIVYTKVTPTYIRGINSAVHHKFKTSVRLQPERRFPSVSSNFLLIAYAILQFFMTVLAVNSRFDSDIVFGER